MESTSKTNLRVGIFLALGLLAISLSLILLGGENSMFREYGYLYAELEQVQGISQGSVVSLAGVTIGNIDEVKFAKDKSGIVVRMKIQKQFLDRIKQDSVADMRTQGALGDRYIYISAGSADSKQLADGSFIPTAKSPDFLDMISAKSTEASHVFDIIDEVYRLMKIINADGKSQHIVENLADATRELKATATESRQLISELRSQNTGKIKETLEHLNSVMTKLDRGEGTLGALINDPSIHDRLKAMLGTDNHKQSIQSLIRTSIERSDK